MCIETFEKKIALVTGAAGFIGFHVCKRLLSSGWTVIGLDSLSDYYDVNLKLRREAILKQNEFYISVNEKLENSEFINELFIKYQPELIIHLAAQAGVRNSIDDPRPYIDSNIIGTFNLLEAARAFKPKHFMFASTSSAYGANDRMPFKETDKSDMQISLYAATKKATENIAHSYSHLFDIPTTAFRFFTVYGPWGRPDMALFKFANLIMNGHSIDVYNHGHMERDFTYVDDLVNAIYLLTDKLPLKTGLLSNEFEKTSDGLSQVAPFRLVNIGNSKPVKLMDYIYALENELGRTAKKSFLPMQQGDVAKTWADTELLQKLTDFTPSTSVEEGVHQFVKWYKNFYQLI